MDTLTSRRSSYEGLQHNEEFGSNLDREQAVKILPQKTIQIIVQKETENNLSYETSRSTILTDNITAKGKNSGSKQLSSQSSSNSFSNILPSHYSLQSEEISQNELNSRFEKSQIKTSTPRNCDYSENIAYKIYRAAGEYWKKFPKTDYTYSKLSTYRRELVPGVIPMPNMSRQGLHQHDNRVDAMIEQSPSRKSYIRKRYQSKYRTSSRDTVDLSEIKNSVYKESIFKRFIASVVTIFHKFALFWTTDHSRNTQIIEKRGFFTRIASIIVSVLRATYESFIRFLYLDSFFLKSSANKDRTIKPFLLLLFLTFLPLLLLAVWNIFLDEEQRAVFHRMYNLVPLSLTGLHKYLSGSWKNFLNLNLHLLPDSKKSSEQYNSYTDLPINIRKTLSPEEHDNIINYVNDYIHKLIEEKLTLERENMIATVKIGIQNKILDELSLIITNTVQEKLFLLKPTTDGGESSPTPEIDEMTLQRIIKQIRENLSKDENFIRLILTQDNLKRISEHVWKNIEIHNQNLNLIERIDVNELILKIFKSPRLSDFIDLRLEEIVGNQKQQDFIIHEMQKRIDEIERKLTVDINQKQNLFSSINQLKTDKDVLVEKLNEYKQSTNEQFNRFTTKIDERLLNLNETSINMINELIKVVIFEGMGYKKDDINNINLKEIIKESYIDKQHLELYLTELRKKLNEDAEAKINSSKEFLLKKINDLRDELLLLIRRDENKFTSIDVNHKGLNEVDVKNIVKDVLIKYDADKTGLADYALESAGGQVLSTRCTENYHIKSAQISIFGIPLWYPGNTPRIAISSKIQPGECWAFQGFPAFLVLKLSTMVYVTGFTLEHIPKSLTPYGKIDSAPQNFTVWGLFDENDHDPVQFGEYVYLDNGNPLQYFPVTNKEIQQPFDIVELRIESNHGNLAYTCLYRFRVHGIPE